MIKFSKGKEANNFFAFFCYPDEPSKYSCLHESIYLATGNHEDELCEVRMLPKGNRVGASLLDYPDEPDIIRLLAQTYYLANGK